MMQVSHQQQQLGGILTMNHPESSLAQARKTRLFVGDIPKTVKAETVKITLQKFFPTAHKIEVYSELAHGNRNRGFAFLEYEKAEDAAEVRSQVCANPPIINGRKISCDWAQLEPEVPEDIMKQVKVLFVRNVHHDVTEEQLQEFFGGFPAGVEKVKRQKMHAFVHFHSRKEASHKKEELNGKELNGLVLEIAWSKPKPRVHPYLPAALPAAAPFPLPSVFSPFVDPGPVSRIRQPDLILPTVISPELISSRSSISTHFQILFDLCKRILVPVPVFVTEMFYSRDPQGMPTTLNKVVALFDNGVRIEGEMRADLPRSLESALISAVTFLKTVRDMIQSQPPLAFL